MMRKYWLQLIRLSRKILFYRQDLLEELKRELACQRQQLLEIAHFSNQAKNSTTCYLGEQMALTRLFTGQLVYVDTRDLSVAPHLLMSGEWEMNVTRHWLEMISRKKPSVIFDVGANVGYYGLIAATRAEGQVHFFEANPRLAAILQRSLSANGLLLRGSVQNVLVGEKSAETAQLVIHGDYLGSGSAHDVFLQRPRAYGETGSAERHTVTTLSLDDYCRQTGCTPQMIKIDVEGYEQLVFAGSVRLMQAEELTVFMEYTPGIYSREFYSQLTSAFPYIYRITDGSDLERVFDQATLESRSDQAMLILDKSPLK
jgi:FkbM family methyltransferase